MRGADRRVPVDIVKLGRLGRLMLEAWRAVPVAAGGLALVTVFSGASAPASTWVTGRLVNALAAAPLVAGAFARIAPWVLLLVALRLGDGGLGLLRGWLEVHVREAQLRHVQGRVLEKATRLPLVRYQSPAFHDALYRAAGSFSANQLHDLFWRTVAMVQAAVALVGLALVAGRGFLPAPLLVLVAGVFTLRWGQHFGMDMYVLQRGYAPEARRLRYMASLLTGREAAKEVRLFALGPHLLQRWRAHYDALRRGLVRGQVEGRLAWAASSTLPVAAFGVSLVAIALRTRAGGLSLGAAVASLYALQQLASTWEGISGTFSSVWGWYLRAVGDLIEFLDLEEPPVPAGLLPPGPQALEAVDVGFAYPGDGRAALRGVSFRIAPGEKVALVGENGAGKTTLVHLLLGLYAPTQGQVRVGGQDLRNVNPRALWSGAGGVLQNFAQYHLTVRENIGFGRVEGMDDAVALARAATDGGAATLLAELPEGEETVLGTTFGGRDLSVGQWQRIATARGFMPEGWLLVLDEPTAALDALAEAEIYRRFCAHAGGRTALMVSHRLGFTRLADRILVLKDGELIEDGTHADLLRAGGEYARLFAAQARWYR